MATGDEFGLLAQVVNDRLQCLAMEIQESLIESGNRLREAFAKLDELMEDET